jgi:hypothetical protein
LKGEHSSKELFEQLVISCKNIYMSSRHGVAVATLQRHNTQNSKQIFPEKELSGLSPNFHIHVSVSDLYIPMIGLPILLQENMLTDPGNIYKSLTDT